MHIISTIAILIPLAGIAGCNREDAQKPPDARTVAEAQSRLATTPEQARLWAMAARSEAVRGLEKIPVVERPVAPRPHITVTDRKAPGVAANSGTSSGAGTDLRILSAPQLPEGSFAGAAKVLRTEGDRLEFDLGDQRILSLSVRAGGNALKAEAGGFGRLDLRVRDDPYARREIVGIRLKDDDGILSVLETGRAPVEVKVPLFDLTARQVGEAKVNTMRVEIRVGAQSKVLAQGETVEFPASRLTVGLISSSAYTGAAAARAEGLPYSIRLIARPTR